MLPKQAVPEGSRKVLNGKEVYTRRNYTTDRGNFFETMGGDFILPNGKPVEDVSILESLPEPQREKAILWWDKTFGRMKMSGATGTQEETSPAERPVTRAGLIAQAKALLAQAQAMEDEESPEKVVEAPEEEVLEESPPEEATVSDVQAKKDTKGSKRTPEKSKGGKESNVLTQMGIQG